MTGQVGVLLPQHPPKNGLNWNESGTICFDEGSNAWILGRARIRGIGAKAPVRVRSLTKC